MAMGEHLPVSESLGVFVGIAGFEWLTDGQAELLKAALLAVASGAAILLVRKLMEKLQRDKA